MSSTRTPKKPAYHYDSEDGLMEEIEKITSPPGKQILRAVRSDDYTTNTKKWQSLNSQYCIVCKEGGELLCCDTCPASFHLLCHEPVIYKDDIPSGKWMCNRCAKTPPNKLMPLYEIDPEETEENRNRRAMRRIKESAPPNADPLSILCQAALAVNTTQFELPPNFDIMAVPNDPVKTRKPDIFNKRCRMCHEKDEERPMAKCDFCLHGVYHFDCVDPPLTIQPKGKWMCPNHVTPIIEHKLLKSSSAYKRRKLWDRLGMRHLEYLTVLSRFVKKTREVAQTSGGKMPRGIVKGNVKKSVKEMYKKRWGGEEKVLFATEKERREWIMTLAKMHQNVVDCTIVRREERKKHGTDVSNTVRFLINEVVKSTKQKKSRVKAKRHKDRASKIARRREKTKKTTKKKQDIILRLALKSSGKIKKKVDITPSKKSTEVSMKPSGGNVSTSPLNKSAPVPLPKEILKIFIERIKRKSKKVRFLLPKESSSNKVEKKPEDAENIVDPPSQEGYIDRRTKQTKKAQKLINDLLSNVEVIPLSSIRRPKLKRIGKVSLKKTKNSNTLLQQTKPKSSSKTEQKADKSQTIAQHLSQQKLGAMNQIIQKKVASNAQQKSIAKGKTTPTVTETKIEQNSSVTPKNIQKASSSKIAKAECQPKSAQTTVDQKQEAKKQFLQKVTTSGASTTPQKSSTDEIIFQVSQLKTDGKVGKGVANPVAQKESTQKIQASQKGAIKFVQKNEHIQPALTTSTSQKGQISMKPSAQSIGVAQNESIQKIIQKPETCKTYLQQPFEIPKKGQVRGKQFVQKPKTTQVIIQSTSQQEYEETKPDISQVSLHQPFYHPNPAPQEEFCEQRSDINMSISHQSDQPGPSSRSDVNHHSICNLQQAKPVDGIETRPDISQILSNSNIQTVETYNPKLVIKEEPFFAEPSTSAGIKAHSYCEQTNMQQVVPKQSNFDEFIRHGLEEVQTIIKEEHQLAEARFKEEIKEEKSNETELDLLAVCIERLQRSNDPTEKLLLSMAAQRIDQLQKKTLLIKKSYEKERVIENTPYHSWNFIADQPIFAILKAEGDFKPIAIQRTVTSVGLAADSTIVLSPEMSSWRVCMAQAMDHCAIIFDKVTRRFELLTSGCAQVIVDNILYGSQGKIGSPCFCTPLNQTPNEMSAPLRHGSTIQIGCAKFIFASFY